MDKIRVFGARTHNLKNINIEFPRDKISVVTGISGSGKSSLAFDTIYAEGQRRYVENLSSYARQFLGVLEKPDVDYIEGLSPAISIDQKTLLRSPRSTVGTLTEIYDYLRLLFTNFGTPYCPQCGGKLTFFKKEDIFREISKLFLKDKNPLLLSFLVKEKKGRHLGLLRQAIKAKFSHLRVDGKIYETKDFWRFSLKEDQPHTIELVKQPKNERELQKAIEEGLETSEGEMRVLTEGKEVSFSKEYRCLKDGFTLEALTPGLFSFNTPAGACSSCQGLGRKKEIVPSLVIPNARLTLAEGAIRPWARMTNQGAGLWEGLKKLSQKHHFSLDVEVRLLPLKILKLILYGDDQYPGVIPDLEKRYLETNSDYLRQEIEKYMEEKICTTCGGKRLNKIALGVKFLEKNIAELVFLSAKDLKTFLKDQKLENGTKPIVQEIISRVHNLEKVGLGYLTLERSSETLAGGEAARIRLASQLSSTLTGILYVLDEPSIGLHPEDIESLVKTLKSLRDQGNTVIVVEHDPYLIKGADYLIDIGPGAGINGGEVVAAGTRDKVLSQGKSLTAKYLTGKREIATPKKRKLKLGANLEIKGASQFNLKNIDVKIPLGLLVGVTGVSGSGKSTLIYEVLAKALVKKFYRAKLTPGKHEKILGLEFIDKAINIDQQPIGRTPRSNLATYTGLFGGVRELFAETPEARIKNFTAADFSFNLKKGRCETCRGDGAIKIEMHFLPDLYKTCEACGGTRYKPEVLEIYFQGKNVADVLKMSVDEAADFFKEFPQIVGKLKILQDVGLGYVPLGQPATTLSGGEAQRIKLATELSRHDTGKTLYILDEPTTGLHFEDIRMLLEVLNRLVEKGNSVVIIEHNLDVIKSCDWLVDLGPGGGEEGGKIVAEGSPEKVAKNPHSFTGKHLARILK